MLAPKIMSAVRLSRVDATSTRNSVSIALPKAVNLIPPEMSGLPITVDKAISLT